MKEPLYTLQMYLTPLHRQFLLPNVFQLWSMVVLVEQAYGAKWSQSSVHVGMEFQLQHAPLCDHLA